MIVCITWCVDHQRVVVLFFFQIFTRFTDLSCIKISAKYSSIFRNYIYLVTISKPRDSLILLLGSNYFFNKQDENINMAVIMKSCTEGKFTWLSIILDVISYYYMYYYTK